MRRTVLLLLTLFLTIGTLAACDAAEASNNDDDVLTDTGDAVVDTSAPPDGSSESCSYPPSQTASQPCCLELGVDACGANLFCAAYDGRTQATCYLEHSRADMTECDEDRQCASSSCNTSLRKCRSLPLSLCETEVGCALDPQGNRYVCAGPTDLTCKAIGDGSKGSACESAADCLTSICVDHLCGCCTTASCAAENKVCNTTTCMCEEATCCTDAECAAQGKSCNSSTCQCED